MKFSALCAGAYLEVQSWQKIFLYFKLKLKFTCRIKNYESIIFIRSFSSADKVHQVEDKNQNWENHPGNLRDGAQFNFSKKLFDAGRMISDPMRIILNLSQINAMLFQCMQGRLKKKPTNQIQFSRSYSPTPTATAHSLPHLSISLSIWLGSSKI